MQSKKNERQESKEMQVKNKSLRKNEGIDFNFEVSLQVWRDVFCLSKFAGFKCL